MKEKHGQNVCRFYSLSFYESVHRWNRSSCFSIGCFQRFELRFSPFSDFESLSVLDTFKFLRFLSKAYDKRLPLVYDTWKQAELVQRLQLYDGRIVVLQKVSIGCKTFFCFQRRFITAWRLNTGKNVKEYTLQSTSLYENTLWSCYGLTGRDRGSFQNNSHVKNWKQHSWH